MAAPSTLQTYDQWCSTFSWQTQAQTLGLTLTGPVNKAVVCWDCHAQKQPDRPAMVWVSAQGETRIYTFEELSHLSNRLANVFVSQGLQPGDRMFVFLDRIPELFIAVMAGLKVGAVVGPLFSAFGPEAIRDRLQDSQAKLLVTSPSLKVRVDSIRHELPTLQRIIVTDRYHSGYQPDSPDVVLYETLMAEASNQFTPHHTMADDPSVIHYTSGTTGKPKGALHRHGAVIAQAATARVILDLQPDRDRYWCTADPGWVTGTAYGMFGPWALGVTLLVYEGPFDAARWYQLLQDHRITVWYTAPTAIRLLMKAGDELPGYYNLSRLRHLASVGEPLNPEAEVWGEQRFGKTFHDTWWQTETGAIHIANYPFLPVRYGSMGKPMPGVRVGLLDNNWREVPVGQQGYLALQSEMPSFFKGYWGREDLTASRYREGWYLTGDLARRDEDGYYWFIGRSDDVINTAGHLVGPFEVESILLEHPAVAEAGVIGKPDPERLEIVKAFVALKTGYNANDVLKDDIRRFVRQRLAAHAYPREIDFVPSLPKTRSGKIMRRLLKARELGLPEGDLSTMETD